MDYVIEWLITTKVEAIKLIAGVPRQFLDLLVMLDLWLKSFPACVLSLIE
jgi:hypothetical protein